MIFLVTLNLGKNLESVLRISKFHSPPDMLGKTNTHMQLKQYNSNQQSKNCGEQCLQKNTMVLCQKTVKTLSANLGSEDKNKSQQLLSYCCIKLHVAFYCYRSLFNVELNELTYFRTDNLGQCANDDAMFFISGTLHFWFSKLENKGWYES